MENLCFVLWMVLFPLGCSIEKYIYRELCGNKPTDEEKGFAALIEIIVWVSVGVLLYN